MKILFFINWEKRVRITLIVILFSFFYSSAFSQKIKSDNYNLDIQYLESLKQNIKSIFSNLELSLEDILLQLDSIENEVLNRFGTKSISYAYVIHKKGVIHYSIGKVEEYKNAIIMYEKALATRQKINSSYDLQPDIINGYNNIGGCYLKLGEHFKGINQLIHGAELAELYSDKKKIIKTILHINISLARAYTDIGDYDNSIKHYNKLINFSPDDNIKNSEELIKFKVRALTEKGALFADELQQIEKGISILKEAERLLISTSSSINKLKANVFNNQGIVYLEANNLDRALGYFKKSSYLNKLLNRESFLAANHMNTGVCFKRKQMLDSAERYLNKSKILYQKTKQKFKFAYVYDNLSDVEFERGNILKSLEFDNKALSYYLPGFNPTELWINPEIKNKSLTNKHGILSSLESKANSFLQLYESTKNIEYLHYAYNTFCLADEIISKIRSDFLADASKMTLARKVKPVYEKAINTCWELYQLNKNDSCVSKAFEFSEKSKAIILLDAIRKLKAGFCVNPELLKEEKELNLKVNYYEKQSALQEQSNTNFSNTILDSLILYRRRHLAIVNKIKKEGPEYYKLIFDQNTINPKQFKNHLDKDQSLIEFFVGDSSLYTFVITRDTSLFIKNTVPWDIKELANEFIFHIHKQDQEFLYPAYKLYEKLILPVRQGIPLTDKIIIVADDMLHSIPFDILVTKKPDKGRVYFPNYKDYLIFDHLLSYSFSASTLNVAHSQNRQTDKTFIGIAPAFEKQFFIHNTYFDQLNSNISEVKQIKRIFQGNHLIGKKASVKSIIKKISKYNIIHLATHGKANHLNGDLSFITFGTDSSDVLYAKDLYALDLNADMVTLSACQTGMGSLHKGEGIISLSRGFIYSGASSVITSLWNVKEEVNKDMMIFFYKGIKRGLHKDEALRNAKLNFLDAITRKNQQKAHPYFWAPNICIGNTNPCNLKSSYSKRLIYILLGFIIGIFILKRKFSNK